MTRTSGAQVRAAAAQVVDAVATHGRSLDVALASAAERLPATEQALLRALAYGTLRQHFRLESWLSRLLARPLRRRDSLVKALLKVGLLQLSEMRIPDHAAVSQTVEAARLLRQQAHTRLLNACLRRFLREDIAAGPLPSEEARYNHPQWIIDTLREDWPDDWQAILRANDERAPMHLRVNRQQDTVEACRQRLAGQGIEASRQAGFDDLLSLHEPVAVEALPGFEAGAVSVQDGAAQLAAPMLMAGRRGRMLDACAAPGGKSAHLLEIAGAGADLTCLDSDEQRLGSVHATLERLQLRATVRRADASKPETWWDNTPYEAILLDAPCSGSGVIRRHPDIKLLRRRSDIERLAAQQQAILNALWPLLRTGGRLLYATCSVFAAENDAVITAFLEQRADAREIDVLPNNNIRDLMRARTCGYQLLPGNGGFDGFYYACLSKVS